MLHTSYMNARMNWWAFERFFSAGEYEECYSGTWLFLGLYIGTHVTHVSLDIVDCCYWLLVQLVLVYWCTECTGSTCTSMHAYYATSSHGTSIELTELLWTHSMHVCNTYGIIHSIYYARVLVTRDTNRQTANSKQQPEARNNKFTTSQHYNIQQQTGQRLTSL